MMDDSHGPQLQRAGRGFLVDGEPRAHGGAHQPFPGADLPPSELPVTVAVQAYQHLQVLEGHIDPP